MPREPSISYEDVDAVANAIEADGGRPNQRNVRERLGRGSTATILRLLNQRNQNKPRKAEATLTLPPALQRAILDFMDQELAAVRTRLETEIAELQQAANDLAGENERQSNELNESEAALDKARQYSAELEGRLSQQTTDLQAARSDSETQRVAAEQARVDLAKAQLRLEAMPRLENDLADIRARLDESERKLHEAERAAAVAVAEKEGLARELAVARETSTATAAELADLRRRIPEQEQRVANAERDAAVARTENESLRREHEALKERASRDANERERLQELMNGELAKKKDDGAPATRPSGKAKNTISEKG